MKKLIYLLLFILPLNSFAKRNIITGKVHEPPSRTIKLLVNNLFKEDRTVYTKRLDKNGKFIFEYDQFYPHDNNIEYNGKLYRYFASPGDSLHFEIKNNSIVFSASHDTLNNELQSLKIRDDFELFLKVNKAQKELEPLEYQNEIFKIQAETDSLLKAYFSYHNSSKELQEWAHYYYIYRTLDDLMRYKMFNPNKEVPEKYYKFLLST